VVCSALQYAFPSFQRRLESRIVEKGLDSSLRWNDGGGGKGWIPALAGMTGCLRWNDGAGVESGFLPSQE